VILRNTAVAGNIHESPAGVYIYSGGLEGVRVRINRFIPVPIVVRIWHLTVVSPALTTYRWAPPARLARLPERKFPTSGSIPLSPFLSPVGPSTAVYTDGSSRGYGPEGTSENGA